MKKSSLFITMFLALICLTSSAQDLTQLISDFKSTTRADNIKALEEAKAGLQGSGVQSLDKMVEKVSGILESLSATSDTIPSVYERVMGETMDGLNNDNVQQPKSEELETLASEIGDNAKAVSDASKDMDGIQSDVSKIRNPLQVKKATSSLNYCKNAVKFAKDEANLQTKITDALLKKTKSDVGL